MKRKEKDIFPEYKATNISRRKLLEIMSEARGDWFSESGSDLIESYLVVFKKLDEYLKDVSFKNNICPEKHTIRVNILTKRQLFLSDVILEYIVNDTYANLPKIYHEIHDYIHDYGNNRDDFSYAELILLQKIITLLLYKMER